MKREKHREKHLKMINNSKIPTIFAQVPRSLMVFCRLLLVSLKNNKREVKVMQKFIGNKNH
jgi:hypothetical protein